MAGQIMTSNPTRRAASVEGKGQFCFSHSAEGRGGAELALTSRFGSPDEVKGRRKDGDARTETPSHEAEPPSAEKTLSRRSCGMALPRPTPRIMAARTSGARRRSPQLSDRKSSAGATASARAQGCLQKKADAPMALIVPCLVAGGARGSHAGRSQVVERAEEEEARRGDEGAALAALSVLR